MTEYEKLFSNLQSISFLISELEKSKAFYESSSASLADKFQRDGETTEEYETRMEKYSNQETQLKAIEKALDFYNTKKYSILGKMYRIDYFESEAKNMSM